MSGLSACCERAAKWRVSWNERHGVARSQDARPLCMFLCWERAAQAGASSWITQMSATDWRAPS